MLKHNNTPWECLDEFRGTLFNSQWPSVTESFYIRCKWYPEGKCFKQFNPEEFELNNAQVKDLMENMASYLSSLGIKKGDRVGLTGKNSVEWGVTYLGILACGAIVCPIDYTLSDEEIEKLLDFAEVKGLFVDYDRYSRIGKDNKYGFKISLEPNTDNVLYALNLPKTNAKYETPVSSDLAAFLFTSGTTGTPKAVMLSHENLISDVWLAQGHMNIYESDVFYAILPIHHAYTMLAVYLEAICIGASVVFGKRLVTNQLLKELKEGKVTMLLAVPMLYNKLLAGLMKGIEKKGKFVSTLIKAMMSVSGAIKKVTHKNPGKKMFKPILAQISLDTNRICISGGGPLPPETFKAFNQLGIDFVQGYGLTETSPIITLNPVFDYEEKSIGKPLQHTDIKIINKDEDGNGEIIVKGPMVMKGYYKNPEATAEIIDSDGYLHTGDVGHIDSRNFVYLTGRAKNLIVTEGGKNVFPEEIEDHFQLYDDIEQICVVGYKDKTLAGEQVGALIYPSSDCRRKIEDKEQMQQHMEAFVEAVNQSLLPYKRIRRTIIIDEPMEITSTKKIKRFVVQKKYKSILDV